jgi:phospholipid/cholesterol/gamma-HCH transport system ATP-binding protein
MIEVQNITKSFDGTEVLKGISTIFEKGKTNLIIGQSGSGKTVFLKCLLGLFEADSGKILFEGKRLKKNECSRAVYFTTRDGNGFFRAVPCLIR